MSKTVYRLVGIDRRRSTQRWHPGDQRSRFQSIADARHWLRPKEPVVSLALEDEARAYPPQILIWHEIVTDIMTGIPIAITFCPLCYSAIAFDRRLDGRELVSDLNFDSSLGEVRAPWLAWGPYLWADGLTARSDGLTWACEEFNNDGTHPAAGAREKVARLLLDFFKTDSTGRIWFLAQS